MGSCSLYVGIQIIKKMFLHVFSFSKLPYCLLAEKLMKMMIIMMLALHVITQSTLAALKYLFLIDFNLFL